MRVTVALTGPGSLAALVLWAVAASPGATGGEGDREIAWDEPIEVASGDGFRGPWRMNRSQFHFVDDPTVAVDDDGSVGVVWADLRRQDLFFQLWGPDGEARLDEPVNVSRSPRIFSWLPRLVILRAEAAEEIEVYVLWQEIIFSGGSHGGEILFARSTDGGRSFSRPINLSNTPAGAGKGRLDPHSWHNGSLDLARAPDGTLHAAWTEYEGSLRVARSTDGGESFSEPTRLAGGGRERPARGPSLAVDGDGTVHLAWTVGEDPAADIRFARSTDGGTTFGRPRRVGAGDGHADAPKIAAAPGGALHLVWAESPDGPGGRYEIRHSRSTDGGGSWTEPARVAAPRPGEVESVAFPSLDLDAGGNLYVLWERFPRARGRSVGLGYAVSADGGRTFSAPAVLPGSADPRLGFNGSQQGLLMRKLAVDGSGRVAVVNSTFRRNESSHVWLFRGRAELGDGAGGDG